MTSIIQQGPEAEPEPGAELPRRAELSRWETLESNDDWWQAVPMRNLQKWQELQGEIEIELQPTPLSDWFQTIFCAVRGGATQPDEDGSTADDTVPGPEVERNPLGKDAQGRSHY